MIKSFKPLLTTRPSAGDILRVLILKELGFS